MTKFVVADTWDGKRILVTYKKTEKGWIQESSDKYFRNEYCQNESFRTLSENWFQIDYMMHMCFTSFSEALVYLNPSISLK